MLVHLLKQMMLKPSLLKSAPHLSHNPFPSQRGLNKHTASPLTSSDPQLLGSANLQRDTCELLQAPKILSNKPLLWLHAVRPDESKQSRVQKSGNRRPADAPSKDLRAHAVAGIFLGIDLPRVTLCAIASRQCSQYTPALKSKHN